MIFKSTILFFVMIYPIKAGLFCDELEEFHFESWCYKLYDVNLFVNFKNCLSKNDSGLKSCFISQFNKILDLYLLNTKIDQFYEFSILNSPFRNSMSFKIYTNLIENIENLIRKKNNFEFTNIFFNVYSFQNHGYIKNQPFKIENPNLLKHSDIDLDNSTEKCLFVHQTKNLNEKFSFKYGNCNKNFSFICIKNPNEAKNILDRCSSYIESIPGGKWIECDKLFKIIDKNPNYLISNSQKCCMYNFNLKVNFTTANIMCSKFDSEVFNFEAKGFTSMLDSYDSYLEFNNDFDYHSNFINFWTSCKINNFPQNNEFSCEKDFKKIEKYDFESPLENGFLIYFLNYSFKTHNGFKIQKLNVTHIFKSLEKKNMLFLYNFMKNFSQNMFLLVRRKETKATNLTSRLFGTKNESCFNYSSKNKMKFSLPILNKCFHYYALNDQIEFENLSTNALSQALKFHDIIDMICMIERFSECSDPYINLKTDCFNSLKKNDNKTFVNKNFYGKVWNISGNEIILRNFSSIEKILEINCYDTAEKIRNLIDDCKKFYHDMYCKFKCPKNCKYDSEEYQVIVWQIGNFKYSFLSSLCKSAYHSNKTHGLIYFSRNKTSEPIINLTNNGIESFKLPTFFNEQNSNYFYFENPVQIRTEKKSIKMTNTLVLLKAVYFVNKDKINSISLKIFSGQNIGPIKLKYLIPLFENFQNIFFNQTTHFSNNIYETHFTVNLTYKKLILINNYFEIYNNKIKFPINLVNKDYDYFILSNHAILRLSFNETSKIKFEKIRNFSITENFSCFWYLYNLNTLKPCSHNLSFSPTNSSIGKYLIFFPKTEETDLNFFKKFTRIIFIENISKGKCFNNGFHIDSQCLCYPGFGGYRCEKICQRGKFGFNCEYECPNQDCLGYLICTFDPIGCSCISGVRGFYCNEECPDNKWGPSCLFDCQYCNNKKCNSFDGSCLCDNKSFGFYCEKCIDGFYGKNCSYKCPNYCIKCNKEDGKCLEEYLSANLTYSKSLNTTKSIQNHESECYLSILKCEFILYNIYTKKFKNSTEKNISCFFDKKTNYEYCNFIEKDFNRCLKLDRRILKSNLFCRNYQNLVKFESLVNFQATFILQNNSKLPLIKKIFFVLLNSSNRNDKKLLYNLFEKKEYISLFIICFPFQKIILNFSLTIYDSCSNFEKINSSVLKKGYYELFTIIETENQSPPYITWIKLNTFLFYLNSQIIENCSENISFIKCELFENRIPHLTKCRHNLISYLIIVSIFISFMLSRLSNIMKKLLTIHCKSFQEETEFIFTFKYKFKNESSF